ncbi:MAG: PAS domain-containing protein [Steroidobacteraceae bacterium]
MSWLTAIWSATVGASLVMGFVYLVVWSQNRRAWANLCFFFMVVGLVGLAIGEMATMHAESPEAFGRAIRWTHFVYAIGFVGSLGFIHFYFGTGRRWLLALAIGLRLLVVLVNFITGVNAHFTVIHSLRKIVFLGEQVSVLGEGVASPWMALTLLSSLAQFAYVVDASVRLWRTGSHESRSRALVLGGALALFIVIAVGQSALVAAGMLRMPFILSFPFLGVVLAMGYELSKDLLRAAHVSRRLRESEQQMALATEAAHLGIWSRDLSRDQIWASDKCRELFGFTKSEPLDLEGLTQRLHPDDRDSVLHILANAEETGDFDSEYRVLLPNGRIRWIASRGRVEFSKNRPLLLRGAALDITARKQAEEAAKSLSGRLIKAQEAERIRLARELHDDLNQSLALLAIELDMLGQKPSATHSEVGERMRHLSAQVRNLSSSVHRISHELHPAKLEQLGLAAAVRGFCREIGEMRNIAIEVDTREVPRELPNDIALCIYRIVQEGLQNVIKHSGAGSAKLELTSDERQLCLIVSDQGCGFNSAMATDSGSLGLVSMRERVRLVRGQISIESRRGEGTRIRVQVPL